ncbi:hypothetical protein COB55_04865 [Candidatus Wolfebacteria bacterium]|nr:MAG: hypothetical protein COB55_04865 [Candidatus Wolfebacteria bacterium]
MSDIKETILEMIDNGLSALPCFSSDKRPLYKWKKYQNHAPAEYDINKLFEGNKEYDSVCIIAGDVSSNFETIDFDMKGAYYAEWLENVKKISPHIADILIVETSQSGGVHASYRCSEEICGNVKLATKDDKCYIETRANGGLILVAPSKGYSLVQGDYNNIPVLTKEERNMLLNVAWEMDEERKKHRPESKKNSYKCVCPIDDFNECGQIEPLLLDAGWKVFDHSNGDKLYTRPGKDTGTSASYNGTIFYVYTSSTSFDVNQGYNNFQVLCHLQFDGNEGGAKEYLLSKGYGIRTNGVQTEDLLASMGIGQHKPIPAQPKKQKLNRRTSLLPKELLHVPGLIDDIMNFTRDNAYHPNHVMAFGGAISLMSFLLGRKVMDEKGTRPNIYILGLANSSCGKEFPRTINTMILERLGLTHCLGNSFASAEGIEDAMKSTPKLLYQTDEMAEFLEAINMGKDQRYLGIMSHLMQLYTSSSSTMPVRRKAGGETPLPISQPSFTIFGTCVPKYYYQALNERMLTNGFLARFLVLEGYKRTRFNEKAISEIPDYIIRECRFWHTFNPRGDDKGNLEDYNPSPLVIPRSEGCMQAQRNFVDYIHGVMAEFEKPENDDTVGMTLWGRANENASKLALIYTCSNWHNQEHKVITEEAYIWATKVVTCVLNNFMENVHSGAAIEEVVCSMAGKALKAILNEGGEMTRTELKLKIRVSARKMDEIIRELIDNHQIKVTSERTHMTGRTAVSYQAIVGYS